MTGFRETEVKYVLLDLHEHFINQVNKKNETCLHVLIRAYQQQIQNSRRESISKASMNTNNNPTNKFTSGAGSIYLLKKKVLILASYLIDKGLHLDIQDSKGYTVIELCKLYHFSELLQYIEAIKIYLSIRKSFIRLRGYTYLNIFYGNMILNLNSNGFINYSTCLQPRLRISIYSTKKQVIEDMIDVGVPVIQDTSSYWWGSTW